jgi:hypothetical protein
LGKEVSGKKARFKTADGPVLVESGAQGARNKSLISTIISDGSDRMSSSNDQELEVN